MAWRCRFLTARPSQDGHVISHPTHWLISTQAPVASSERLYDMAGRLLTAPTTGAEVELRAIPNLPSFADTLRRTLAALDAAPDVANRERLCGNQPVRRVHPTILH